MTALEPGPQAAGLIKKAERLLELAIELRRDVDPSDVRGAAPTENLIEAACASLPEDGTPVVLRPFFGFGGDILFGYQADTGVVAEARCVSALTTPGSALEITVLETGLTEWLTLEIPWRWDAILKKESAHVVVSMTAHPVAMVQPRLRLPILGGGFRDRLGSSLHVGADPRVLVSSVVANRAVLVDVDMDVAPRMLFFFNLKPCTLRFEKLFGW